MDFYLFRALKTWVKIQAINMVKHFFTVLKRAIQKTAEATGDLICNKITDKIIIG